MTKRAYFSTGLFVIILMIGLFFIGFWLAFGIHQPKYYKYVAIFNSSIHGLQKDATVEYNGVPVGKVASFALEDNDPSHVRVYLDIAQGTPIQTNTFATLRPKGITGMNYVALRIAKDKEKQLALMPNDKPPFPEIRTRPPAIENLLTQSQQILKNVDMITQKVGLMLSPKNMSHFNSILQDLNQLTKTATEHSKQFDHMITNIDNTFSQVQKMTKSMNNQTLPSVNNLLIPNLNHLIQQLQGTSTKVDSFLEMLNQNPDVLIRGKKVLQPNF